MKLIRFRCFCFHLTAAAGLVFIEFFVENVKRGFFCGDKSIAFKRQEDTISIKTVILFGLSPILVVGKKFAKFQMSRNLLCCLSLDVDRWVYFLRRARRRWKPFETQTRRELAESAALVQRLWNQSGLDAACDGCIESAYRWTSAALPWDLSTKYRRQLYSWVRDQQFTWVVRLFTTFFSQPQGIRRWLWMYEQRRQFIFITRQFTKLSKW